MVLYLHHLFKGHPSQFIKIFFDFAYYICISPYRFVLEVDGTVTVKQWIPQKVICIIIYLLSILHTYLYRWKNLIPEVYQKAPPQQYFFILSHVCSHLLTIVTFQRVWLNRKEFANILSFLCERNELLYSNSNANSVVHSSRNSYSGKASAKRFCRQIWDGFFFKSICLAYLVASGFYADYQLLDPLEYWHKPWPWENAKLIEKARDAFGYWGIPEKGWVVTILTILLCLGAVTRGMMRYLGHLLLVSGVLTLWNVVHTSVDFLKSTDPNDSNKSFHNRTNSNNYENFQTVNNKQSNLSIIPTSMNPSPKNDRATVEIMQNQNNWSVVYGKYQKIRTLTRIINTAFGPIIILSVARAIIYNSANMDDALHQRTSTVGKVLMILLTVNDIVVFLLAADSHSQMDNFRVWISNDENHKNVPSDQLNVVLQELNSGTIGIRGGNMFTITYSLLWNALTTVLTYFIIFMQTTPQQGNGQGKAMRS